ncbi:MAG TPA: amidohydrolase family protein [Candidatus Dormibacteraeota bacterium]|nr:amidohydrolase family protein [Candidatus Dormibacteraeota bacterium]
MPTILGPAFLAIGDGSSTYARLAVERGRIAAILPTEGPSDHSFPEGSSIAPGLIDLHTNGAQDALFNRDQGNAIPVASRSYAAMGATGFVASVMTAPWESMLHAASEIVEAAHEIEEGEPIGARCLGVHFEGPFLAPKYRRVHRGECLLPASAARAQEMIDACRGALVMVTLAPEVPGASEFVRRMLEHGVLCSAGHTGARYAEGLLAIGTGYRSLTHAFNGMPALDHREPSLLAAFMQDRRTVVQVICDGHHVAPPMIDLLYRMLGDRVVLATDYMPPAGPGYRVEGGVMRADDGTIAGSALTIDRALLNYMAYTGLPFAQAIVAATNAPARAIGKQDEIGRIAVGMRADLSFWDARHEVIATMVGGEFVYQRAPVLISQETSAALTP